MHSALFQRALHTFGLMFSLLIFSVQSFAQGGSLSGKITDPAGNPLSGATVKIKGATATPTTNEQGMFSFNNAPGSGTLIISYVGYTTTETRFTAGQVVNISLAEAEAQAIDEVVVTGVFDRRKRLEASIAISTINDRQLARIVPSSATDLLKNLPGVFVNASRGEVSGSVYTRGLSVGGGFYYVSMQEDGLPIMVMPGAAQPDAFLRADATVARVEAVRGGTASILGANAPGGIFNYVSKAGGQQFAGEVRTRFGLEGNGRNPYLRGDVNVGGPIN
ncbi:MAG: TonB-dependent receptor, partial [Bacteroidota bacterium]|nr:TonB-dependent receptor [Bacteroidota bacterium]